MREKAAFLVLLLAALPARAQDTAPTSSSVVARVEKLLRVPVKAATGGKVTLAYDLRNETHAEDFESFGVEGPVTRLLHGRGVNGNYPDLGAEFETTGFFLNKLPLKGDITIECQVIVRNIDLERSDMVVLMGYDEKARHWVGARYGQLLVESNGHRVAAAPGSEPLDFTAFENLKVASIKLVRSGKKVSAFLNGRPRGTVTTSQGDGRCGFLLTGLHVAFASLSVTGVPDLK
jgi:hypothetical protein